MSNAQLYDDDFYAWTHEQAELLRAGKFADADIEHIAQEIESMGKTEKRELINPPQGADASSTEVAFPTDEADGKLGGVDQGSENGPVRSPQG